MFVKQLGLLALLGLATAQTPSQLPHEDPALGQIKSFGCFNDLGEVTLSNKTNPGGSANTDGVCGQYCQDNDYKVAALYADMCHCGNKYPPKSALVADKKCNEQCPGFAPRACGGLGTFSVYNTGKTTVVAYSTEPEEDESDGDSPSSTTVTGPSSTDNSAASTAPAPNQSSAPAGDDSGDETSTGTMAGIAVGCVAGVLLILGVGGGIWFFRRKRKNSELEEEHRRNAAVNAFIGGGKPPSTSSGLSMSDSRLDPVFANRRMSDGSIADNQDYSRRILRVTNA